MSRAYWLPWPLVADILNFRFPEMVGVPGSKERPALVLEVETTTDSTEVRVVTDAYVTSQEIGKVHPAEFVIEAGGTTGLTKAIKFDLINRLPLHSVWFGP